MGYRVRNQDGELRFQSFDELRQGYLDSMVEADDEVQEDGSNTWRKASAINALARMDQKKARFLESPARWYFMAAVIAVLGIGLVWAVLHGIIGFFSVFVAALAEVGFFTWLEMRRARRRR